MNVIAEVMVAKANAIAIDELKIVIAKPTASPTAAEIAIWRHFGEIIVNRLGDCEISRFDGFLTCFFNDPVASLEFIGAPTSSLVQQILSLGWPFHFPEPQTFPGEAMNRVHAHNYHFHYARCRANQLRGLDSQPDR